MNEFRTIDRTNCGILELWIAEEDYMAGCCFWTWCGEIGTYDQEQMLDGEIQLSGFINGTTSIQLKWNLDDVFDALGKLYFSIQ